MIEKENYEIRPPKFSNRKVIELAENLSYKYLLSRPQDLEFLAIGFDVVYEQVIYPEYEIMLVEDDDLGFDGDGEKILGMYDPLENTAYIDRSLDPMDPRYTFTRWHEVGGHGVLQGRWLRSELERLNRTSRLITTSHSISFETESVLERQANLFAAHAGAPFALLDHVIHETFDLSRPFRYCGRGRYDVKGKSYDVTSLNDLCRLIARHIQSRFGGLSLESLSYSIEKLKIVKDCTSRVQLHRKAPRPLPAVTHQSLSEILLSGASV